jgi:hypothetical protein
MDVTTVVSDCFTSATRNVDVVKVKQVHNVNTNQYSNRILSNDSAQVPRKLIFSYAGMSNLSAPYRHLQQNRGRHVLCDSFLPSGRSQDVATIQMLIVNRTYSHVVT